MATNHFDAFVRSIPLVARRSALRGLLSTGFLALASQVAPVVEARKNGRRKKRKKKRQKKRKTCTCEETPQEPCPCSATQCGESFVDLTTDPNNCGACGHVCLAALCVHGACACVSNEECAEGCFCVQRAQGAAACANPDTVSGDCSVDADCPLGTFCIEFDGNFFCSGSCP